MATILDAAGKLWAIPEISWVQVRRVNHALRSAAEDLPLPRDKEGQPIWDWHRPEVQGWYLGWGAAPVFVAALLLEDQAKLEKMDESAFAGRWKGDALDRLRAAIWQEFVLYLPTDARALAQQIERSIQEQRANAAGKLIQTFDLLIEANVVSLNQQIETAQAKLMEIHRAGPGPSGTSGGSPDASASTPAPSP